jgi:ABC-2 type transport system permease protein
MLFVLLLGMTQVGLIMVIGRFLFGVYYGSDPLALILVSFTYILAVGSIGLCLGFVIRNQEKLVGIAVISSLGMAAMSGCWWPMEISPPWMQKFSLFLPSGLALKSYHLLISFGKGLESVWPYLLALLGITVLFSTLFGVGLYRYQEN